MNGLYMVMKEWGIDSDVVACGLQWDETKVLNIASGAIIPTQKDRQDIEKYIEENGFEVIKVRKINGQFVSKNEELSKILEDYYTNLKK